MEPETRNPKPETLPVGELKARIVAISLSFIVGSLLMAVKFYAYWLTNSSAVLSDALESIINVVASAFALWSVVFSARPPDESHPYGHGKIEYFSAGFEGALIILAAFGIFQTGVVQILSPHELPHLDMGLLVLLGASAVNCILGAGLIAVGKRTRSLVLVADGRHVMTDVYTSAGVLVGLGLVRQTGWYWMDGAVACAVGVNILVLGARLVREASAGLMHKSDPKLLEEICAILIKHRKERWIDVHRLRAWRSGSEVHIDFHLIMPRDLSLEESHNEIKHLEKILIGHFGSFADILIHADPCIDPECPVCGFDPCGLRKDGTNRQSLWRREEVISEDRVANRSTTDGK